MSYQFSINCQFDGAVLDRIYQVAFGYKTDGWFVEVGASNGQDYSNTCGLADLGWHGIYIEPVPELARQCRERHASNNNVTVLRYAVGGFDGTSPLWLIPEWGTATANKAAAHQISKSPQMFQVEMRRLDWILGYALADTWQEVPNNNFDLLVIDVDFGEIDVLQGFNIKHWMPKLVIIELHEESNHPLSEDVRKFALPYFRDAGYTKIYKDNINTIFSL